MLIDDVTISVKAGTGGDGLVAWNKNKMSLGPTGGDGGKGGDVYLRGVLNIGALSRFRNIKDFAANDGKTGEGQRKTGKDGKGLVLDVPIGTVVHNLSNKQTLEIERVDQQLLIAKGGEGGRGNFSFRSSRNTSPKQYTSGKPGEKFRLRLELKLIADVGLIGFPNAGKSTLLNSLTSARSKVANYPFTTLEPNLGVYYELILADIPGLIAGAAEGKGLGIKFLRHIERTKILFHLISAHSKDPAKDYRTIRNELRKYSKKLLQKKEYVFLSRCDDVPENILQMRLGQMKKAKIECSPISILEDDKMQEVKNILNQIKLEK